MKCSIIIGSVLILLIVTFIRATITEFVCLNAGRVLHNKYFILNTVVLFLTKSFFNRMFHRFVRAPISFFDTNPIGMNMF
jgi:hypothetical protein